MVSTHYDTALKHIVEVSLNGRCPQIILDVFGNSPWNKPSSYCWHRLQPFLQTWDWQTNPWGLHSLRLVVLLFLEALDNEASPKSTDPQSVSLLGQSLGGIQHTSIYINIPTTPHALEAKFSIWKPVQPRNLLVQLHWTIALDMLWNIRGLTMFNHQSDGWTQGFSQAQLVLVPPFTWRTERWLRDAKAGRLEGEQKVQHTNDLHLRMPFLTNLTTSNSDRNGTINRKAKPAVVALARLKSFRKAGG